MSATLCSCYAMTDRGLNALTFAVALVLVAILVGMVVWVLR